MAEIEFVKGVRVYLPRQGAPQSLVANIVFEDGTRWNLWRSKAGNSLYLAVDNWKPSGGRHPDSSYPAAQRQSAPRQTPPPPPYPRQAAPPPPAPRHPELTEEAESIDDIPFDPPAQKPPLITHVEPTADEVYPNRARGSNYCGD